MRGADTEGGTDVERTVALCKSTVAVLLFAALGLAAPISSGRALTTTDSEVPPRTLSGLAVEGSDRVVVRWSGSAAGDESGESEGGAESEGRIESEAGSESETRASETGRVSNYANTGYRLRVRTLPSEDGGEAGGEIRDIREAVIEVDLAPMGSDAVFAPPPVAPGAEPEEIEVLARQITGRSTTRYGAVSSVLGWLVRNIVTGETAALAPASARDEAAPSAEAAGSSQRPADILARGSGTVAGIADLAVALLKAVRIEARPVNGRVVGKPEVGSPWGPHTWIEVRYPRIGWVFSDPLHHHHYVPATYLRFAPPAVERLTPAAGSALPTAPPQESAAPTARSADRSTVLAAEATAAVGEEIIAVPGLGFRLAVRQDERETVDLYPAAGPGVTARKNLPVQRAAALRVVVSGPHRGSAVLQGPGRADTAVADTAGAAAADGSANDRVSKVLVNGESVFVGLDGGTYRLEVYLEDRPPIVRQVEVGPRQRRAVFLRQEPAEPQREKAESPTRPSDAGGDGEPPPRSRRDRTQPF